MPFGLGVRVQRGPAAQPVFRQTLLGAARETSLIPWSAGHATAFH